MEISDNIYQSILESWSGKATPEQRELVAKWRRESPEHEARYRELFHLYYQVNGAGKYDKIDAETARSLVMRQLSGNRKSGKGRKKRFVWYWRVAAASVILFLGIWLFVANQDEYQRLESNGVEIAGIVPGETKARLIMGDGKIINLFDRNDEIMQSEDGAIVNDSIYGLSYRLMSTIDTVQRKEVFNVLQVPTGGFYRLELSDGTQVWLNAETELRYPVCFVGNERKVYLTGEAYFKVAKDVNRPFRVFVEEKEIRVLGTSFNVCAYPDDQMITTTLVEGSVGFRTGKSGQEIKLKPGFQCRMNVVDGSCLTEKVDVSIYTAWVDGRFVFQFMNLETIMRQLQRWYDFETIYLSPEVRDYEFRGVIERNSKIEDVFRAIELTTDVKFSIEGKTVTVRRENKKSH